MAWDEEGLVCILWDNPSSSLAFARPSVETPLASVSYSKSEWSDDWNVFIYYFLKILLKRERRYWESRFLLLGLGLSALSQKL